MDAYVYDIYFYKHIQMKPDLQEIIFGSHLFFSGCNLTDGVCLNLSALNPATNQTVLVE